MVEMRVNPGELAAGGRGLEEAAASIPEPLAPFASTGTDALSTILASLTQQKEAPLIAGLPVTKAEALATAQNIVTAAGMYERSDQQIATDVQNASARLDGAGGAGGASSVGGAGQMQQMMSMPMQTAQSVSQLPQGIMQGVQSGIQQIGQMTGGTGQFTDGAQKREDKEPVPAQGAAPGPNNPDHAPDTSPQRDPEPGAVPPKPAQRPDPGIVL